MIIFKPPLPVVGAPNLNKGIRVFDCVVKERDTVLDLMGSDLNQTIEELSELHSQEMVQGIMAGKRMNGYANTDDASNQHSLLSCKILKSAAIGAFENSCAVFAPVSGFHHSGYRFCEGYCTFNGLVLAASAVREMKHDAQVLVIDGDGHFGNGTQDFIDKGLGWLDNCTLSKGSVNGRHDKAMSKIKEHLEDREWDLIIYQAGADSHRLDPYQAGYLNDDEWVERDRMIFEFCKDKIPLVFNLAGGYAGQKTIELHTSTVKTYREVYEI